MEREVGGGIGMGETLKIERNLEHSPLNADFATERRYSGTSQNNKIF